MLIEVLVTGLANFGTHVEDGSVGRHTYATRADDLGSVCSGLRTNWIGGTSQTMLQTSNAIETLGPGGGLSHPSDVTRTVIPRLSCDSVAEIDASNRALKFADSILRVSCTDVT